MNRLLHSIYYFFKLLKQLILDLNSFKQHKLANIRDALKYANVLLYMNVIDLKYFSKRRDVFLSHE